MEILKKIVSAVLNFNNNMKMEKEKGEILQKK